MKKQLARIAIGTIVVTLSLFAYVIISQAQINPNYTPTQIKTDVNTQRERGSHNDVQINKIKYELTRLAGPVCPLDGKRAIEHIKYSKDNKILIYYDFNIEHDKVPEVTKWVENWINSLTNV